MSPSILVRNALVHTMWVERPQVTAILFEGGRVKWVGDATPALSADKVIDAGGRALIPGLIDAHCHPFWMAHDRLQLDLGTADVDGISPLLDKLRAFVVTRDADEWVIARGVHEGRLSERRLPTRDELDSVSDRRPIVVKRGCGHALIANSRALYLSGVSDRSPDPYGGIIERSDGRATGVLREAAAAPVLRRMPVPPTVDLVTQLRAVGESYLSCGVVGITEAAVGFTAEFDREWAVWNALRAAGTFPIRLSLMPRLSADSARSRGLQPSGRDFDWEVDTLKFFADGTLGSRTAALSEPYESAPRCCGFFMQPPTDLDADIRGALRDGWNVAVHAIGDRAIDAVAASFKRAGAALERTVRLRIEHLGMPSTVSLQALDGLGAIAVPQYGFLREMGDGFVAMLGRDRAERLYPGRSLLDHGLVIAGSSDAPATPISPFFGMAAAIDRTTSCGLVLNARERLTNAEAIGAYTTGAAAAAGHAGLRGQLSPGALADALILDQDPFECSAEQLRRLKVRATIVRGRVAYEDWGPR